MNKEQLRQRGNPRHDLILKVRGGIESKNSVCSRECGAGRSQEIQPVQLIIAVTGQSTEYDLNKSKESTADIWTAEGNQDVTTKTTA
ncbi:unnamed protein product [Onchocerca flexuosa]|uniref:Uncharacterized protein n=1 Tax=Onchocerca flexuosa TaxID=387005 RepID=A0A183HJJ4_9BILA|nr:unnamed protein product [Onchocerca flexuosa]